MDRFPNPLGFGKAPSRFSDPRRRVDANRFGILYLGDTRVLRGSRRSSITTRFVR